MVFNEDGYRCYTSDLASMQHVLPWMVNVIQIGLYSVLTYILYSIVMNELSGA